MSSPLTNRAARLGWQAALAVVLHGTMALGGLPAAAQVTPATPGSDAPGPADFDPRNARWNGLSELVRIARDEGITIETPSPVELDELKRDDALLLVYPTRPLPRGALAAFLRRGGHLAVADDFGKGGSLLSLYEIERDTEPELADAPRLRGNPGLPLARPRADSRHPLARQVRALVANHPTTLVHPRLEPVFSFGTRDAGLVLAGAVEEGRLLALGDPSVLINNMMRFRDNARFARNLLRYMHEDGGRVVLGSADTRITSGGWDATSGNPVDRIRGWFDEAASAELPPAAVRLAAMLVAVLWLVIAVSSLPRNSPYEAGALAPEPGTAGGLAGHVRHYRQKRDLFHPLMVYKLHLEQELARRLELPSSRGASDLVTALRHRGLTDAQLDKARSLLRELEELRQRESKPPGPPRVGRRRFHRLVATGEWIVGMLHEPGASHRGDART